MAGLQTIPKDYAELAGRVQMAERKAQALVEKLEMTERAFRLHLRWTMDMVRTLIERRIDVPRKQGASAEALRIESGTGALMIGTPDGVAVIEDAAAANDIILRLMEHSRQAWPDAFPEVF